MLYPVPQNNMGPGAYGGQPYRPPFAGSPWQGDPYAQDLARARFSETKLMRRRCSWAAWAVLLTILFMNVVAAALVTLVPSTTSSPAYYFIVSFSYVVSFALGALLLARALHMPLQAALPMQRLPVLTAVSAVFVGTALCNVTNYPTNLVSLLLESLGLSGTAPSYAVDSSPLSSGLLLLSTCVIPALVEEFLFRGVILRSLMRFGAGTAILISAFLFALMHGNVAQIVFAFPLGVLFALFVVRTGNIWITIAIHFLNNLFSSLYLVIEAAAGMDAVNVYSMLFPPILWVLGIAGLLYLLLRSRGTFFRLPAAPALLAPGQKGSALFGNPGMILFLCFTAVSCVLYLVS